MKCRRSRQKRGRIFGNRKYLPCVFCSTDLSFDDSTLEHIIPLNKGGTNISDNLAISCKKCNSNRNSVPFYNWYVIKRYIDKP